MHSLHYALPTLILCGGSLFVLLLGLWVTQPGVLLGASLSTVFASFLLYTKFISVPAQDLFSGLIVHDSFSLFFALFSLGALAIALIFSAQSKQVLADRRSEYYAIIIALGSGLIFMSNASHLLMAYLALETVSILSYTLAGFHREKTASVEASMKYVIYGSLASALMVFGMSLLYGITGSMSFDGIREFFASTPSEQIPHLLWMSLLLIFAGMGYKISAAPMHMWTPDVYEGAPTPVSAFLSVAPKAAGLALLIRFFVSSLSLPLAGTSELVSVVGGGADIGFHTVGPVSWARFILLSSIFSMFMGNLAALKQVSVKRILAYSSIAHAGYMLMGASTQSYDGIAAILFYILIYCLMNLGAFWIASLVEDSYGNDTLATFKGLIYRHPLHAVCMAIFLFSLVGLPPFAGYIAKFYIFKAVLAREFYGLALIAAINSVISLYYYAKILKAMFFEKSDLETSQGSSMNFLTPQVFILLLALPNLVLGVYWEPIMEITRKAVNFFGGAQ